MLILLDIDGVLVPANSWKQPEFLNDGFPAFNSVSAKALQYILSETDASIILTTSHKLNYTLPQWREIFKLRGINPKDIDRLSSNSLTLTRKEEIQEWYNDCAATTQQFVIIDDDKQLNGLPVNIKSKLILTSASIGLTLDLADKAISILKGDF